MIKSAVRFLLFTCFLCFSSLSFSNTELLSKSLNNEVSVTGNMTVDKFKSLLEQGFKSVIVNRPDQEPGNITKVNELRNLAEKSQVSLIYQPVISGQISDENAQEFAKYYNSLPKPILLVCKSGSRSTVLFNRAKSLGLLNE